MDRSGAIEWDIRIMAGGGGGYHGAGVPMPTISVVSPGLPARPPAESDMILVVLSLIDLALVASLVVMVMFSSYENFVSKLDIRQGEEKLHWLGKLDAGTLKLKVAASIVAISSIHLLQAFVNIPQMPNDKRLWYVIIHLTFVISAVLLGVLDRLAFDSHRDHKGFRTKGEL
jgi:uncharacterized protein (TIGR00645 family)